FTAPGILQPLSQYRFREPVRTPMAATLGVRPEHVRVNTPDAQPGFRVDLLETHGADNLMWCANDSLSLQIRLPGTISYPLGTAVSLAFDADQLSLFGGEDGERL
ncbi:MAG: TOBE domain-containing protein, partial [Pannonibacter indicus]